MLDSNILRFCVSRAFDLTNVVSELMNHLEWRQTNIPIPRLTDATLNLLGKGILYIHGRTKDFYPILVLDFLRLSEMLRNEEIIPGTFCSLHNFMSRYCINNMMLPGQVEKWITICNINQFSIRELPVYWFKACAKELGGNYVDRSAK